MDDFPVKIADFLESITERIRSMTVDRVAKVLTYLALRLVAMTLVSRRALAAEGAAVGLLIGYFATRFGGEGKETVGK